MSAQHRIEDVLKIPLMPDGKTWLELSLHLRTDVPAGADQTYAVHVSRVQHMPYGEKRRLLHTTQAGEAGQAVMAQRNLAFLLEKVVAVVEHRLQD